jgi:peptidyl-tRNA hydrolase, PTH1 family
MMKLIVGLGNPGIKYKKTRHNLGFRAIDELAEKFQSAFNAKISEKKIKNQKVILAKPQTFMNNSGAAVKSIADYYKIPVEDILVIHDDIDLPLGEIKVQQGRGAAGHKGVQSIIDSLNSKDFIRIRIGVRPAQAKQLNVEKFVLQKFTTEEEVIAEQVIKQAANLILATL